MARRGRSSFTAVEVLLTIGVVGVLSTLLLPVFAQERERARQAVCLANIRTIAQALRMYLADTDGRLPPVEHDPNALAYFNTRPGGGLVTRDDKKGGVHGNTRPTRGCEVRRWVQLGGGGGCVAMGSPIHCTGREHRDGAPGRALRPHAGSHLVWGPC